MTRIEIACDQCGWTGAYDSQARANYAHRRHSCDKQRRLADRRQRGLERAARVDRIPKPCQHKEAHHEHGTPQAYVLDQCRCLPCAASNRAYEKDRNRQQAYGRWNGLVDAEPARRHVRALMAAGMGLKSITEAGISAGTLTKLLYGHPNADGTRRPPARRIRPETAEKILAVQLQIASGAQVDATGTVRRVCALVALGWSQSKIAARLGITRVNFWLATEPPVTVTARTARAVAVLYDDLSMTLPPTSTHRDRIAASRAKHYAAARHWLPPLALDDDRLDDPAYEPEQPTWVPRADDPHVDDAAVLRRMHGDKSVRLSKMEAAELVRRWKASGRSLNDCYRITGLKPERYFPERREASA